MVGMWPNARAGRVKRDTVPHDGDVERRDEGEHVLGELLDLLIAELGLDALLAASDATRTRDEKTSLADECQKKKKKVEELCTSTPRGCPSLKATRPFSENT